MTNDAQNAHPEMWAQAAQTLNGLISKVGDLHQTMVDAHRNLNWEGPSEQYFQQQASRQDSYLNGNLADLGGLLTRLNQAEADARAKQAQPQPASAAPGTHTGAKKSSPSGHKAGAKSA